MSYNFVRLFYYYNIFLTTNLITIATILSLGYDIMNWFNFFNIYRLN